MSALDNDIDALVGTTTGGKYHIDALLGRGGMGAVFQATNTAIGKRVALKFLYRDAARDRDAVIRFQREAESASAAESAHIVQIFDSGSTEDGLPFLVMELLKGEDLRGRLRREGKLPLAEVVHIAGQVARALKSAHAAGIVHRDLKPDNVFLCERDDEPMFVKLVDFGISKVAHRGANADTLTHRGVVLGTAFYMSPEQAKAERDIDGRTDLFSLGAIMYEALAGRPPHEGTAYEAVLIDICTRDADDVREYAPNVPEPIAKVLSRALARDRNDRFGDAQEMYDALVAAAPSLLKPSPLSGSGPRLAHGNEADRSSSPASDSEPDPGRPSTAEPDSDLPPPADEASSPSAPRVVVPSDGAAAYFTGQGTALAPTVAAETGLSLRRTALIGAGLGLGALALAAWLVAASSDSTTPSPGRSGAEADPAAKPPPAVAAAPPMASTAPGADEEAASAASAGSASPDAPLVEPVVAPAGLEPTEPAHRPHPSVKGRSTIGGKPTVKKRRTGVAKGLELVTEP